MSDTTTNTGSKSTRPRSIGPKQKSLFHTTADPAAFETVPVREVSMCAEPPPLTSPGGLSSATPSVTTLAGADRSLSVDEKLQALGLTVGMIVGVDGEKGTWRIQRISKDGSLTCVGGRNGQWRSFLPEWCYRSERPGRGGKMVPGSLPADRRGLRAAWIAEHRRPPAPPETSEEGE